MPDLAEVTVARLSFWVAPGREAAFRKAYASRLQPLLQRHGLAESRRRGRATPQGIVARLFDLSSPGDVKGLEQALRDDRGFVEALGELGRRYGRTADDGAAATASPIPFRFELYSARVLLGAPVSAGPGRGHWRTYDVHDGLPEVDITCIAQDREGHLWFGTQHEGVVRFDGQTFKGFTTRDGLAHNWVDDAIVDREGQVWFATHTGATRYDGRAFTTLASRDGLASDDVYCLLQDRDGNLWFGTGSGVTRWDGDRFTTFTARDGLVADYTTSIFQDSRGDLWFGTAEKYSPRGSGASRYDGHAFTAYTTGDGLPDDGVRCIAEDRQGKIWLGTNAGACRFDGSGFHTLTSRDGLANDVVTAARLDRDGALWFGTWNGGVSRYDGHGFANFSSQQGLAGATVHAAFEDRDGILWFGTWQDGVSAYDRHTLATFTAVEGAPDDVIHAALETRDGALWLGTQKGAARYDGSCFASFEGREGLAEILSQPLLEDGDGTLWFGFWFFPFQAGIARYRHGRLSLFTAVDGLPDGTVRALVRDREGHLWIATFGGGVCRFDGRRFTTYTTAEGLAHDHLWSTYLDRRGHLWFAGLGGLTRWDGQRFTSYTEADGLPHQDCRAVVEDPEGDLWIVTHGGGVCRFDGESFTTYTTRDGLASDHVWSVLCDQRGRLWFGTWGGGVSCYDGAVFQTIARQDGLPSSTIWSMLEDRAGRLWFVTHSGLTRYTRPEGLPPRAAVDAVVADRRYGPGTAIALPTGVGLVALEFHGVSLKTRPEGLVYRYRLEGHDADWHATRQRRVEYPGLGAGSYCFQVCAVDRDLVYSEPAEVDFQVVPDPRDERIDELERRVRERTADLEERNRALTVERALERVRVAVAGMQESQDLSVVVDTLGQALRGLAVRLDGVSINVIDEEQGFIELRGEERGRFNRIPLDLDSEWWREFYERWKNRDPWVRYWTNRDHARVVGRLIELGAYESEAAERFAQAQAFTDRWIADMPFPHGTLAINRQSPEPFTEAEIGLLRRFAEVFEMGYSRFVDLQAAEERARRAARERAVERVRAEALSMRTSEEMRRVVAVMWRQMRELGIATPGCSFQFVSGDEQTITGYSAFENPRLHGISWTSPTLVAVDEFTAVGTGQLDVEGMFADFVARWRQGEPWSVTVPQDSQDARDLRQSFAELGVEQPPPGWEGDWVVTNVPFAHGTVGYREREASAEHVQIVRDLTDALSIGYLRFLDFQRLERQNTSLAEANRDLEVERALERVRTAVAGMVRSDELDGLVRVVHEELASLGVPCRTVAINLYDPETHLLHEHLEGTVFTLDVTLPFAPGQGWREHWERRDSWHRLWTSVDLVRWAEALLRSGPLAADERRRWEAMVSGTPSDDLWIADAYFERGSLAMNKPAPEPFADEHLRLLERFTEVFALGYKRHLDLASAEERARQAELERAVEHVRSEALSMRTTDDMNRVVAVMWRQMLGLGIQTPGCSFQFIGEPDEPVTVYLAFANPSPPAGPPASPQFVVVDERTLVRRWETHLAQLLLDSGHPEDTDGFMERWRAQEPWSVASTVDATQFEQQANEWGLSLPAADWDGQWMVTNVPFAHGTVGYRERERVAGHAGTVRRLTDALSVGYLRFLDFQRLERQNRELEVERSLERVRTAVARMERSADLENVVDTIRAELQGLQVPCRYVSITTYDPRQRRFTASQTGFGSFSWDADTAPPVTTGPHIPGWLEHFNRRETWVREFTRQQQDQMSSRWTEEIRARYTAYTVEFPDGRWVVEAYHDHGAMNMNKPRPEPFSDADVRTFERFTEVFGLGYRRHLDLAAAEERARQSELARARQNVRAVVTSMESADDIYRVVDVLRDELRAVGVPCDQVGINIIDPDTLAVRTDWTSELEVVAAAALSPLAPSQPEESVPRADAAEHPLIRIWRDGAAWSRARSQTNPGDLGWVVDVPFQFGTLAMNRGQTDPQVPQFSEEEVQVLQGFAEVVSLGYTRFRDIQQLEEQNRQLTIDRAVERVRAAAMAMESKDDLPRVTGVMHQQLRALGIDAWLTVTYLDRETGEGIGMHTNPNPRAYGLAFSSPSAIEIDDDLIVYRDSLHPTTVEKVRELWRTGKPETMTSRWTREDWWEFIVKQYGVDREAFMASDYLRHSEGDFHHTRIPFSSGMVGFGRREAGDADVAVVQALTNALDLGFVRFLAFKRLEERSRRQAIEAAAERVRAAAMAMESEADLRDVVAVLFKQVRAVGIDTPRITINFIDRRSDEVTRCSSSLNPRQFGVEFTSPDIHEFDEEVVTGSHPVTGEDRQRVLDLHRRGEIELAEATVPMAADSARRILGIQEDSPALDRHVAEFWEGVWQITRIPFDHGYIAYDERRRDEASVAIVQQLIEALNLGFVRFLDFQRLDDQNQALELANQQIQEANRLKSQFLANMSHELRTPMNAIVGFSKIVYRKARTQLDERQVANLEKVLNSAEILLALINDILDLSKIEAGRLEVHAEAFDLRALVSGCLDTVTPILKTGVALEADLADAPESLLSDPARVRQVVVNLLANAAKFTEAGQVHVGVRRADRDLVEIAVRDTGIGIPPDKLDTIFEQFRQADGTTTRKYGGTGLGLSISRRLAQMLGGDIRVASQPGAGSTFTLSLPLRMPSTDAAPESEVDATLKAPQAQGGATGRIVLAIDDDPDVISLITQELEEEGYRVVGAERALEGIQKAHQLQPHAITLDIMMPGMDGWETITRLKEDPQTRDIPIIVVSIIDNKELGYHLGADEYLVKPVDREALARVLARFEGRGREVLVCDDDPVVVDLTRQLLEEDRWTVRSAANGQEALEQIARRRPDVLLLDLMMPVLDGFETLSRLRADAATADLPVVVITAKDLAGEELEGLRANVSRIIAKDGLDRQRLLREVRAALRALRARPPS